MPIYLTKRKPVQSFVDNPKLDVKEEDKRSLTEQIIRGCFPKVIIPGVTIKRQYFYFLNFSKSRIFFSLDGNGDTRA
jgi:hypothetical protein